MRPVRPQMSMLNNMCVTYHVGGGVISFVHPSKPLENENNFEIWGDVGGKVCPRFEYFVHLRYVMSIPNHFLVLSQKNIWTKFL